MEVNMIWAVIAGLIVICDQITKYAVFSNIKMGHLIPVINNFFYITHVENYGAAWSMFQGGRYFFIVVTIITTIGIILYIRKSRQSLINLSLSFVLGGAVGNLIDRVVKGGVTDFLEFHFGSYIFPVFNVADIFVVVGTFLLAFLILFIYK